MEESEILMSELISAVVDVNRKKAIWTCGTVRDNKTASYKWSIEKIKEIINQIYDSGDILEVHGKAIFVVA